MTKLVDALFYLNNSMMGMGDSYSEYVSELWGLAFGEYKDFDEIYEEDKLDKLHKDALKVLSKDADFLKNSVEMYCQYDNEYFVNQAALCGETNKLLNALVVLEKYSPVLKKSYEIFNLISFLKEHGEFIEKCAQIGWNYWTYLDNDLWGTQTNSSGTIGEVVLEGEYPFVLHLEVNQINSYVKYDVFLKEDEIGIKVVIKNENNELLREFYPNNVDKKEIEREIAHSLNSVLDKHNRNK